MKDIGDTLRGKSQIRFRPLGLNESDNNEYIYIQILLPNPENFARTNRTSLTTILLKESTTIAKGLYYLAH